MKLDFRQKLVRDSSRLLSAVLATSKSLRLRYVVLATFPVACFATYIIGILTDTLGFDLNIWVQLQAGIWMWTAMAVLAMLPGSLKESMGRVCFLAGLFGLFIPATVYVVAMSESDSPNDMGSEWFWFVLHSGLAAIIGVGGIVGYLRLRKADDSTGALDQASRPPDEEPHGRTNPGGAVAMLALLKSSARELLRLLALVISTFPMAYCATYMLDVLVESFGGDPSFRVGLEAGIWMWIVMVVLGMLPGSLKESMSRVCFLAGALGLFLPLPVYILSLSLPDPADVILPTWWCFIVYSGLGAAIGFGGIVGYLHLTKPDALARAFAPASPASSGNPPHKTPPTDGAAT